MLFKVITTPTPANPKVADTEFKTFASTVNRNMAWETLVPFIQQAEDIEIVPAIGQEFYDVLHTEYQDTGAIADDTKAHTFRLLRTACAHYCLYAALPQLTTRISDAGANETMADNTTPVRQWAFTVSRWETAKTAYKYMDMALEHAEKQVLAGNTAYDDFKNSDAYTYTKAALLPSAKAVQRFYNIQSSRRAYTRLRPYILKVQDIDLPNLLGQALTDALITQHTENSLTAPNTALLELVRRFVAERMMTQAIPDLNFIQDGNGWMISENLFDTKATAVENSLQQMLTRAEQNASAAEMAVKNLLYANLDDYPLFRDSGLNELATDDNTNGIPDIEENRTPPAGAFIL